MDKELFWQNVNNLIKLKNITQESICDETRISLNTLRGWVSKNVLPRADEAYKIAKALNTSVEYLVSGRDPDNSIELMKLRQQLLQIKEIVNDMKESSFN